MNDLQPIILERMSPVERIQAALERCDGQPVLTTSFGIQSAVLLHMVTQEAPEIPVIFIDTGFLFPETLEFAAQMTERLGLNLKTFHPKLSAEELISQHGELWDQGVEGLERYNQIVKVEPMQRALAELVPMMWFAGLRRSQSETRKARLPFERVEKIWKIYPIIDWSDRQVYQYLKKHKLPYHPLWDQGYLSVGDVHSSAPLGAGRDEASTRFSGMKRECGLHENFQKKD